jgi:hypothetical protein
MELVELHRRQWIISHSASLPSTYSRFRSLPLNGGRGPYLHFHAELHVQRVGDGGALLVGTYVGDFENAEKAHHLTGRFIVIDWPWLVLDAVGCMGVYAFNSPMDIICSSSIALISELSGLPLRGRRLIWGSGINWDPVPTARVEGVRKLFCDQALNLETGIREHRPRTIEPRSESAAIADLSAHLIDVFVRLKRRSDRIVLNLTAGKDSRLILSALVAAGVPFTARTLLHNGRDSEIDARIAGVLCRKIGIRHSVIAPGSPHDQDAARVLRQHNGGSEGDSGETLAAGQFYRDSQTEDVIVGGSIFGVGRRHFEEPLKDVDFSQSRHASRSIARVFNDREADIVPPLRLWHRYRTKNPISGMDFVDAFYLDQRLTGWRSSIGQSQDAFPPTHYPPACSWTIIECLLGTECSGEAIQMAAMERMLPGLSKAAPINPHPNMSRRLRHAVRARLIGTCMEAPARYLAGLIRRTSSN